MPFVKGQSGNPSGSSKRARERVAKAQDLASDEIEASIKKLVELRDTADEKTAYLSCLALLERACGKSRSPVEDDDLETRAELNRARAKELDLIAEVERLRCEVRELMESAGPTSRFRAV